MQSAHFRIVALGVLLIAFFLAPLQVDSQNVAPETLSRISKGLADWTLMHSQEPETQPPKRVYVTNSLATLAERTYGEEPQEDKVLTFSGDPHALRWERQWQLSQMQMQTMARLREQQWKMQYRTQQRQRLQWDSVQQVRDVKKRVMTDSTVALSIR